MGYKQPSTSTLVPLANVLDGGSKRTTFSSDLASCLPMCAGVLVNSTLKVPTNHCVCCG
eukprot:m.370342 g.370342  ORF g.370342 m.370342 type:complete len:59 (+) comp54034_c0_seq1:35-211(+)